MKFTVDPAYREKAITEWVDGWSWEEGWDEKPSFHRPMTQAYFDEAMKAAMRQSVDVLMEAIDLSLDGDKLTLWLSYGDDTSPVEAHLEMPFIPLIEEFAERAVEDWDDESQKAGAAQLREIIATLESAAQKIDAAILKGEK